MIKEYKTLKAKHDKQQAQIIGWKCWVKILETLEEMDKLKKWIDLITLSDNELSEYYINWLIEPWVYRKESNSTERSEWRFLKSCVKWWISPNRVKIIWELADNLLIKVHWLSERDAFTVLNLAYMSIDNEWGMNYTQAILNDLENELEEQKAVDSDWYNSNYK